MLSQEVTGCVFVESLPKSWVILGIKVQLLHIIGCLRSIPFVAHFGHEFLHALFVLTHTQILYEIKAIVILFVFNHLFNKAVYSACTNEYSCCDTLSLRENVSKYGCKISRSTSFHFFKNYSICSKSFCLAGVSGPSRTVFIVAKYPRIKFLGAFTFTNLCKVCITLTQSATELDSF